MFVRRACTVFFPEPLCALIMICHLCNEWRPRRYWADIQWRHYATIAKEVVGCKECRLQRPDVMTAGVSSDRLGVITADRLDTNAAGDETPGTSEKCRRIERPLTEPGEIELLYIELETAVRNFRRHSNLMARFTYVWMELPRAYRKTLSHFGAVRSTHRHHPVHGFCDRIGAYFDPGNAVYAMTLKAICPCLQQAEFNDETLGDVCEAWLAIGARSDIAASRSLMRGLEYVAGCLYIIATVRNVWSLADMDKFGDNVAIVFEC